MACSGIDPPRMRAKGGYATASAITVSMSVALVASALSGLAGEQLRSARNDLRRLQTEYALAQAHRTLAVALMKNDRTGRLEWRLDAGIGTVAAMAEPESAKLGYGKAAALDNVALARLGVADPDGLRARLKAEIADGASRTPVRDLDQAALWRTCAASLVSRYGAATVLAKPKIAAPNTRRFSWRGGEVWRVRLTAPDGWSDERIERFTGNPRQPAAVIERSFSRQGGADRCDAPIASG